MEVAIAYWTGNGDTRRVAEHVAAGAGPAAWLLDAAKITRADWDRLNRAATIIFGAPTYMGSVAAGSKAFMDASGDLWEDQLTGPAPARGGLSRPGPPASIAAPGRRRRLSAGFPRCLIPSSSSMATSSTG